MMASSKSRFIPANRYALILPAQLSEVAGWGLRQLTLGLTRGGSGGRATLNFYRGPGTESVPYLAPLFTVEIPVVSGHCLFSGMASHLQSREPPIGSSLSSDFLAYRMTSSSFFSRCLLVGLRIAEVLVGLMSGGTKALALVLRGCCGFDELLSC